jgi:hypothetical protein
VDAPLADPDTPEAWLFLCQQHEEVAKLALTKTLTMAQAHFHAGIAVECALKAYIMRTERLNSWPSRSGRADLYTHDLRQLLNISALSISTGDPIAPAWNLVMQWDRNQGYDPTPMPERVAKGWVDAAFGREGVVTWLRAKLT